MERMCVLTWPDHLFKPRDCCSYFWGCRWCGRGTRASPRRVGVAGGKELDSWLWEGFLVASGELIWWNEGSGMQGLLRRVEMRSQKPEWHKGRESLRRWRVADNPYYIMLNFESSIIFGVDVSSSETANEWPGVQIHLANLECGSFLLFFFDPLKLSFIDVRWT